MYEEVLELLKNSKRIAALTGAGISAESGIPTFRGKGGLWEGYPVDKVASVEGFYENPELVWKFYDERRVNMIDKKPNRAHEVLAQMEKFFDMWVITQNIDGLHTLAGSKNVVELHGNIWNVKCTTCSYRGVNKEVPLSKIPPRCPNCGAILRPDVVWFGEQIHYSEKAFEIARSSELFFVIGTSAQVYPAASLPFIAKDYGAIIVEINPEPTPVSVIAEYVFREPATQTLDSLFQRLQGALQTR